MPTFETPEPISVTVDIVGDLRVTASDRTDTVVSVLPRDPSRSADVKAAEHTRVDLEAGRLSVRSPKHWRPFGGSESVAVTIDLPTGSGLDGTSALGDLRGEGELGACRLKTSMGSIRLDHTGDLHATTAFGDVVVDRTSGEAEISTGSGDVRLGEVGGDATIRNSNGDSTVGAVRGDLQVKAANGDVVVDRAGASVTAKTANGDVRIGHVRQGSIVVETALGELEVGIQRGTAAWLDLHAHVGAVRNTMDAAAAPAASDLTVEVRARTACGDIVVHRATDGAAGVES